MYKRQAYFIGLFLARVKQAGVSADRMISLMRGATWRDVVAPRDLFASPAPRVQPGPVFTPMSAQDDTPLLAALGLTYRYPSSGGGINSIALAVDRGRFVVVTGRIGSGKTTLLSTVLGLLPADAGSVIWNGEEVPDPKSFMKPPRTAYTPQVPRLFSLTLDQNLRLGVDATNEQVAEAIHTATMEKDVASMPDGLETLVGPRGVRLSGGQIQRSAAARMLVRRPELLVFDDLSSALDVETEQLLWDRLFTGGSGATALVVSHRKPALQRADLVIVLRDGSVVAKGTAEELLQTSEEFQHLWAGEVN